MRLVDHRALLPPPDAPDDFGHRTRRRPSVFLAHAATCRMNRLSKAARARGSESMVRRGFTGHPVADVHELAMGGLGGSTKRGRRHQRRSPPNSDHRSIFGTRRTHRAVRRHRARRAQQRIRRRSHPGHGRDAIFIMRPAWSVRGGVELMVLAAYASEWV